MIPDINPIAQAALGTLLTWGLTAAGAGMVIFFNGTQRKLLDASLGFAGGVMIAASYWSLLAPAIQMAEESGTYGANGEFAFAPVAVGFFFGAFFVFITDVVISKMGINSTNIIFVPPDNGAEVQSLSCDSCESYNCDCGIKLINNEPLANDRKAFKEKADDSDYRLYDISTVEGDGGGGGGGSNSNTNILSRRRATTPAHRGGGGGAHNFGNAINASQREAQWKRILLLIIAITVHNIPEGLAVGVAFGAIGSSASATFESARNLAIGIGIQNFPEGLAVSLPLKATGFSTFRSFWYGQLSGMVEPLFGVIGAAAVTVASPILPYALSFAAGAMIYVVIDDIIPEANTSGNGRMSSWGAILGFLVMMVLDVGLG